MSLINAFFAFCYNEQFRHSIMNDEQSAMTLQHKNTLASSTTHVAVRYKMR